MSLDKYDNNTYIHYGKFETKGRTPSVSKNIKRITTTQPLSNNTDYLWLGRGISTAAIVSQPDEYTKLMNYIKTSPELIAVITAFVTDILSDGHYFEGNESNVKQAEEFFSKNNMESTLYQWLVDVLIYGNGFLVKNFITETQIKSVFGNTYGFETKAMDDVLYEMKEFVDEIATKNMSLQYMPAFTVSIFSKDKFGNEIIYKQNVGTNSVQFDSSEVVHLKDIDLDGKLYGYSRIYSIKSELQTLAFTKDYFGLYFENNATPDKIFIGKNMKFNSEEHKDFVVQLQDLKKPENKRKNLLALSDIDVMDMNVSGNSKEFAELMKDYTSLIAMTYQMPPSRYGGTVKATAEEATLSNQGYYRNVSSWQDKVEVNLNRQLWLPIFDVKLKFNRNYKEDEQREVLIQKTKVDIVQQLLDKNLIKKDVVPKLLGRSLNLEEKDFNTEEDELDTQVNPDDKFMQRNFKDRDALDENERKEKINHTPKKYGVEKDN